jgi:DNA-binding transcriptional regulator PaaX
MRLGPKARSLLDLLYMTGFDALEAIACPRISIFNAVGWTSDRNFYRHLSELRGEGWIDWEGDSREKSWLFRITESGKDTLLESVDPAVSWSRQWDEKWRMLSFDLPQSGRKERRRLDAWLRKRRFGHLQGSVWISHRPYSDWTIEMEDLEVDPRAVLFQECVPLGRNKNADYVAAAWNFDRINEFYQEHIAFLESNSPISSQGEGRLADWLHREGTLWKKVFRLDPFLPECLLPSRYLGKIAWRARRKAYRQLGKQLLAGTDIND